MIGSLGTLLRDGRGVAALELALVVPVMLVLFFGTVEITQLIRASNKLDIATQSIENMIAGQKSVATADVDNAYKGGQLIMAPFGATLAIAAVSVTFDSSGAPSGVAWQVLEGGATAVPGATACAMVAGLGRGNDSVILVQGRYGYSAAVHYILPASFSLSYVAFGRPRNVNAVSGPSTGAGSC